MAFKDEIKRGLRMALVLGLGGALILIVKWSCN